MRYLLAVLASLVLGPVAWAQAPDLNQALAEMRTDVQGRAEKGGYPIAGMNPADARAVLASIHSLDRDEWAAAWSARADMYMAKAKAATSRTDKRDDYLAAWRLYMFGGWPARTSPGKEAAYHKATAAYRLYGALQEPPMTVVRVPYEGKEIVGYLRLPVGVRPSPVVISMGGLDEFKEYAAINFEPAAMANGLGVFAMDMPGVGESPVAMEIGSERVFSKVIDVLSARKDIDPKKIGIFGVSAGGYWSVLMAYVEAKRLAASASLGAPTDHYFDADWQRGSWGTKEYLFGLKEARMFVYGNKDEDAFLAKMAPFSLKRRGILSQPSTAMLIGNGAKDTQIPIADLYVVLNSGSPKFAWVSPNAGHTGMAPGVTPDMVNRGVVAPWLASVMKSRP